MAEGHKTIVKRFYGQISKGNFEIIEELISDDLVTIHGVKR